MKKHLALLSTLAALAAMFSGAPAHAAKGPTTGAIVFTCTASLPVFPTPSSAEVQGGTCTGGASVGAAVGVDDKNEPFVIAGTGGFSATFNYSEFCPAAVGFPPEGFADGQAFITGVPAVDASTIGVVTANIKADFHWLRVGLTAIILDGKLDTTPNKFKATNQVDVTFSNGNTANDAVGSVALAAFVPNPIGIGTCGAPASATATVAGVDAQIA